MSADDYRPALVPGHGAPPERADGYSSSGVNNVEASMRGRANAVDWAKVAPWFVEGEERREKEREERERGASA